jgi:segregation and condensation protein B
MEISHIIPHIEALIFASDRPLNCAEITELINNAFGFMEDKILEEQVAAAVEGIIEKYDSEFYPFEVRESGGGLQFLTKKDYHKTIAQINGDKFLKRLSAAALETLAIIAYKQPITKGEIEAIRGVSSDYTVQKLLEKELIVISGRNEELPGKPLVYSTSKSFMDYFGLNSADELPKIREVLADQLIEPTYVNEAHLQSAETAAQEGDQPLAVAENGELVAREERVEATEEQQELVYNVQLEITETIEIETEIEVEDEEENETEHEIEAEKHELEEEIQEEIEEEDDKDDNHADNEEADDEEGAEAQK